MQQLARETFYIHARADSSAAINAGTVFLETPTAESAGVLNTILQKEYPDLLISVQSAASVSFEDSVLYTEAIESLSIYDDPDPGIYDPRPDSLTLARAGLARRAENLGRILAAMKSTPPSKKPMSAKTLQFDDGMRAASLELLLLLSQAYYHLIERRVALASWASMTDMALNASYVWVTSNLTNLLKNDPTFSDFPTQFEPIYSDLYPSTIGDIEWEFVAPAADRFLSTVQRYLQEQHFSLPLVEGSNSWAFVEMFRPSIDLAIKRANAYYDTIKKHLRALQIRTPSNADTPQRSTCSETQKSPPFAANKQIRTRIFISYCHKDEKFLKQLRQHLKPLERGAVVSAWSDEQIKPGSEWYDEIQSALNACSVAVLLVTPGFLASDFIHEHELGPLLQKAEIKGVTILWVLVRDCLWKKSAVAKLQAAIPTDKPIANMKAERDRAWVSVCAQIEAVIDLQNTKS